MVEKDVTGRFTTACQLYSAGLLTDEEWKWVRQGTASVTEEGKLLELYYDPTPSGTVVMPITSDRIDRMNALILMGKDPYSDAEAIKPEGKYPDDPWAGNTFTQTVAEHRLLVEQAYKDRKITREEYANAKKHKLGITDDGMWFFTSEGKADMFFQGISRIILWKIYPDRSDYITGLRLMGQDPKEDPKPQFVRFRADPNKQKGEI